MVKRIFLLALAWSAFLHIPASASSGLRQDSVVVADSTNHWGYGYDSLLRDLEQWRKNPFVKIDSIGASVQGRAIWMLTITDSGDSLGPVDDSSAKKHRVFIHARTHPAEVQAFYVARGAIKELLDSGGRGEELRHGFIFNIIPMYNPDGVELGHSRLNANLVDLEGDWDKPTMEPEPMALKKQFQAFQAGTIPIEVALNLHSDQYNCTRFFFFHSAAGTSAAYEDLERTYIAGVRSYFPDSIKNWNYLPSWTDGFKSQYPESFWWLTQRENVMALTYEDTNCPNAGQFDSTGRALVLGSGDYIQNRVYAAVRRLARAVSRVLLGADGIRIAGAGPGSSWELDDIRGRRLAGGALAAAQALLPWSELPAAPMRILAVSRPAQPMERIPLPLHP